VRIGLTFRRHSLTLADMPKRKVAARVTIWIPEALREQLEAKAAQTDLSISWHVRRAIEQYLNNYPEGDDG
jgi:predicted HicB family RNase H-like nuclease